MMNLTGAWRQRTAQLQIALEDLGAFSYSVAHDLRSPLKNIKALSEHLVGMAAMRGDGEERDLSQRIHKGSTRLIALVDDLLRFARTDSQEVSRTVVDIGGIARTCIANTAMETGHVRFRIAGARTSLGERRRFHGAGGAYQPARQCPEVYPLAKRCRHPSSSCH
ncbi:MAG: hypothetical protein LKM36_13965 [Flavobacteriales bacterium]|nr:hypothetical protein [Flavobacteriales bacterium]